MHSKLLLALTVVYFADGYTYRMYLVLSSFTNGEAFAYTMLWTYNIVRHQSMEVANQFEHSSTLGDQFPAVYFKMNVKQ